jgi:hypothetical protein
VNADYTQMYVWMGGGGWANILEDERNRIALLQ